jgi:hypothetical protein
VMRMRLVFSDRRRSPLRVSLIRVSYLSFLRSACGAEFPVEDIVVVTVHALLEILWGIGFVASAMVVGSVWWYP